MRKTRLQIAKQDIVKHFDSLDTRILKLTDIVGIMARERSFWRLAQSTTAPEFTQFLIENAKLKRLDFPFPYRSERRFVWGDVPLLEVLLTIKPGAYFTHYTAMRMHGLTEQVPKTIYLNHEQRPHIRSTHIEQRSIDAAFSRKPRVSNNIINFEEWRICLINGMHTDQLGVVAEKVNYDGPNACHVRLTNLERTLIDIAVRPIYAGGVPEVLKAFRLAQEKVSVNRLAALLQKLDFVYPYHQAIGYYLEQAGYKASSLELLRRFPMDFDFYLTYDMKEKEYKKDWRLYVPKGI